MTLKAAPELPKRQQLSVGNRIRSLVQRVKQRRRVTLRENQVIRSAAPPADRSRSASTSRAARPSDRRPTWTRSGGQNLPRPPHGSNRHATVDQAHANARADSPNPSFTSEVRTPTIIRTSLASSPPQVLPFRHARGRDIPGVARLAPCWDRFVLDSRHALLARGNRA
jgi:hypothetical protein